MIWRNYVYNWFDMTDRVAIANKFALQDVDISVVQRQEITDNANDHWSESSRTLASGRLFSFSWKVVWLTKEIRWQAWDMICDAINLEPFMGSEYLHDLLFQTDSWEDRQVKVLVKTAPKWSNWLHRPEINFVFELYAPWFAVYWISEESESWSSSVFWWTSFANKFGDSWWSFSWDVVCNNEWNYKAWCEITVTWELVNPIIKNITNWNQYKINWTTNNLVLNSKDGRTVKDWWIDISYKRDYGTAIMLSPWLNTIVVFSDWGNATFTVKRFSAWNTI